MYLTLLALGLVSDEFRHKVFKDSLRDTRPLSFVRSRVGYAVLQCACCIKIANHLRAADPSLAHGFCRIAAMLCPPTAPAFVLRRYCLRTVVSRYHIVYPGIRAAWMSTQGLCRHGFHMWSDFSIPCTSRLGLGGVLLHWPAKATQQSDNGKQAFAPTTIFSVFFRCTSCCALTDRLKRLHGQCPMCRLIMYALLGSCSAVGPPHQNDQRADHGACQAAQEGGQATLRVEGQSLAQPAVICLVVLTAV